MAFFVYEKRASVDNYACLVVIKSQIMKKCLNRVIM